MTKVSNLFLTIIVATLALYGGAKWYLNHKAQALFEQISAQVMPFGDLSYGDISTSLSGSIVYKDLSFTVREGGRIFTIRSFGFETSNPGNLFKALSSKGGQVKLPDQFSISVKGMVVGLNGPLMARVDQFIAETFPESRAGELICDRSLLGPAQYRTLGYKFLESDFSVDYRYYTSDFSITTNLKFDMANVANGSLSIRIKDASRPKVESMASTVSPLTLGRAELLFQDAGYTERANQYCADLKGMSVDDYIIAVVNQRDDYYLEHWGFVPGKGLRWAYRTFLTNPGKTRVVIRPPEPFDMRNLMHYAAKDLPDVLGLSVEVNGQPINDLTVLAIAQSEDETLTAEQPQSRPEPDGLRAAMDEAGKAQSKDVETMRDNYKQVALGNLEDYLGNKVRIVLHQGAIREGWLAMTTDDNLKIEQRLYNGTVSMLVDVKRIDHVEVLSAN